MKHICAYCKKEYEANSPFSHIIPKQIFRRMKKEISNKEIYSTYYSRKTQREPVEFLLCHKCEAIFSKWETKLSNQVTNVVYNRDSFSKIVITKEVKLAILSILWRILKNWVVKSNSNYGSLSLEDVKKIKSYEQKWYKILKEKKDFTRADGNAYIIPVECVADEYLEIESYKKHPGIMADAVFYDQGDGYGYYCIRCFAHRVIYFAYLTPAFNIPREFSIHNPEIFFEPKLMPSPILNMFKDYSDRANKIKL